MTMQKAVVSVGKVIMDEAADEQYGQETADTESSGVGAKIPIVF